MFSTPPKGESLFVEALEARIAPTGLTGLANNPADSGDARYVSYSTAPTAGTLGFVPASVYGVAGSNVYALKLSGDGGTNSSGLSNGDQLIIYNSATGFNFSSPFIQAVNGNVIAFFQDKNGDGQVQSNELTGIALGKGASIDVNGNVNGDIVTNLSKDGNSITLTSAGKANTSIASIDVLGNVTGSIFAGGNINNITVTGNVDGILAGSAVNGIAYHFGDPSAATATLSAAPLKDGKVGASISNVTILSVTNNITAGDGGLGAAGGSVSAVTFQGDTTGLHIFSGNGGDGNASVRGGPGGDISAILVKGVSGSTANSLIDVQAGHGGNDPAFKGGKGGSVDSVAVSFDSYNEATGAQQISADLLTENIIVQAGAGGAGLRGGQGGDVTNSLLYGIIPADGSGNAEIQVLAGVGGTASVSGQGHGGSGGSISQVSAENLDPNSTADTTAADTSSILVQAGDGGAGRDGGNVTSLTILGKELTINAGNGGDGVASGGLGGSLNSISILNNTLLVANYITLDAGIGGAASAGNGGAGGNIATVTLQDSDLASLVINGGAHANGGVGTGGVGGAGGSLSSIQLGDSGSSALGVFTVRGGTGGDGTYGGGLGGEVGTTQIVGTDFSYQLTAGAGGNILSGGKGRGGAGGTLDTVGISDQPFAIVANGTQTLYYTGATGDAAAGAGGNGNRGGAGGDVSQVDLSTAVDITLLAGAGGSGSSRKTGAGGAIASSVGDSLYGSVTASAGNAGQGGASAADGGSITAFIAAAENNISITSGNGTFGGAGGDIANSGTNLDDVTQAINTGNVTVTAGNGSSFNGVAGAGGSISVFSGYIGTSGQTAISAGAGGGGNGSSTAAGAGGSVDQVKLTGAGVPVVTTTDTTDATTPPVTENPVLVTIDAGDAGYAGQVHRGATGGSVTNVTIYNLAPETTVQHIAAGDGGGALKHGGAGGSITQVNVGAPGDTYADIGFRSGVSYGYAAGTGAGGLFAGAGGTGAKSNGSAGNVTNITANAISSIVAGKGATPQLVGTVDGIFLEGLVATVADSTGAFTNFATANLVGSVINPTAAGASAYQPGDGLIATASLTDNRNFVPEALLTLDANGALELVDYQQPNPSPVITPNPDVTAG